MQMDEHFNFSPCVEALTYEYYPSPPPAPTGFTVDLGPGFAHVRGPDSSPPDDYATLKWNDPSYPTITKYQYQHWHIDHGVRHDSGWIDIPGSDADTTSYKVTGPENTATTTASSYGRWTRPETPAPRPAPTTGPIGCRAATMALRGMGMSS